MKAGADILTFSFTKHPESAIAEEAADDVWGAL